MVTTRSCSGAGRREQGMSGEPTLEAILLAQIEHHATEVFYNLDPVRYPSAFVRQAAGLREDDGVLARGAVGKCRFHGLWRRACKLSFDPRHLAQQGMPGRTVLSGA